ncbi:MAG: thioredoxin family protein [Bacteroidia bacterium]|nr:MAG: thioredoxin family protein [Bacteroidia bacterium]
MNWNKLESESDLSDLINNSTTNTDKYFLIFKHSTRCPVSAMSLYRLEKNWSSVKETVYPYFLDLIKYRPVSNKIEEILAVRHESPQLLLIKNGKCIYHQSHHLISVDELNQQF